jgi:hypothetical protein
MIKNIEFTPDMLTCIQEVERREDCSFNEAVTFLIKSYLLATNRAFICEQCGKLLPISEFFETDYSGLDYCKDCRL